MKGQAFDTLRVLLGAVFAVILLVLVYSIVASYSSPLPGIETCKKIVSSAFNAPGECITANGADFTAGEIISKTSFNTQPSMSRNPRISSITCSPDGCEFGYDLRVPVSAKCSFDANAGTTCNLFFASHDCGLDWT